MNRKVKHGRAVSLIGLLGLVLAQVGNRLSGTGTKFAFLGAGLALLIGGGVFFVVMLARDR